MNNKNKLHVYKYYCTHVLEIIGNEKYGNHSQIE